MILKISKGTFSIYALMVLAVVGLGVGCHKEPTVYTEVYKLTDQGVAEKLGTIKFEDRGDGMYVKVKVGGLTPGEHGFHVHVGNSCGPMGADGQVGRGMAAGDHYDPSGTGRHLGPDGNGHAGDLPVLVADSYGVAETEFIVPDLTTEEIINRTIIIHDQGDNYSDEPQPQGGSGGRFACGVIESR